MGGYRANYIRNIYVYIHTHDTIMHILLCSMYNTQGEVQSAAEIVLLCGYVASALTYISFTLILTPSHVRSSRRLFICVSAAQSVPKLGWVSPIPPKERGSSNSSDTITC